MKHVHYTDVALENVEEEGAKDAKVRWLITKEDGAENFAMRLFEVEPNGYTPYHQHDWEHEVFVLEGEGVARHEDGEAPLRRGDVLFVPPMTWHSIKNTGKGVLKFLCLIPYKKGL